MTNLDTAAGTAPARQARRPSWLRRASPGALVMLIVQFGPGIGVNRYVTLRPPAAPRD